MDNDIMSLIDEAEKANGVTSNQAAEETPNDVSVSDTESEQVTEATSEETSASANDTTVEDVTTDEPKVEASETSTQEKQKVEKVSEDKPRKEYHRSEDPLSRARYAASKYKQKYNSIKNQYEERLRNIETAYKQKLSEFQKFSQLDPASIENDVDRQEFFAWKEASANSLDGMREKMQNIQRSGMSELNGIENARRQMIYDAKVENCYGDNDTHYRELDSENRESYDMACEMFDRDNVIKDFLEHSDYEPAIMNVLYENDKLQEDLFVNVSKNPMIAANQRLNILRGLENSVAKYYASLEQGNAIAPKQVATAQAATVAKQAANVANVARPAPKRLKHIVVNAPKANVAPKPAPKATGSITRGNEAGGEFDSRNVAENTFKQLFGF